MRKIRFPNYNIYAVIDIETISCARPENIVTACINAGIEIIQLRDKTGNIHKFLETAFSFKKLIGNKALFIVNDRLDIAKLCGADGLHIGQTDLPVWACRRLFGANKIIGKSCHSLEQARAAQEEGADYISIGPVFSTPTKPEYRPVGINLVKKTARIIKIPIVAIGGISTGNVWMIKGLGAKSIAVVREICGSKNITQDVKKLRQEAF